MRTSYYRGGPSLWRIIVAEQRGDNAHMDIDELIDAVAAETKGTRGDPLTREEVAAVVTKAIELMAADSGPTELEGDDGERVVFLPDPDAGIDNGNG